MSSQRASQLVEAGVWLQATGDQDGARRLFEQALKLDPDNARAKQFLGKVAAPAPIAPSPVAVAPPPPPVVVAATPEAEFEVPAEAFSDAAASSPTIGFGLTAADFAAPPAANPFAKPASNLPPAHAIDPTSNPFDRPPRTGETLSYGAPANPRSAAAILFGGPEMPGPSPSADAWFEPPSAWEAAPGPSLQVPVTAAPPGTDALGLVTEAHTPLPFKDPTPSQAGRIKDELRTLLRGAQDLVELDDHSGALELIMKALELDPLSAEAQQMRERSETTLLAMYESRLGRLDAAPRIVLKQDEIIWLNLDHRAGFVLAQIDGAVTFDDLFSICGMTRLDTARILAQLVEEGVVAGAAS